VFGLFWSIENVYNVPTTCCRLPDYYKQDYHLYICIQTYYHLCNLIYVCHVFIFCTLHFSVYTYVNLFMSSLLIVVFFSILRHTSLIVKKTPTRVSSCILCYLLMTSIGTDIMIVSIGTDKYYFCPSKIFVLYYVPESTVVFDFRMVYFIVYVDFFLSYFNFRNYFNTPNI
jgi:hypothetical protein